MKKLTVEYSGYKLEVEILSTNSYCYPIIKGTCEALSFLIKNTYGEYQPIIDAFMKYADVVIEKGKEQEESKSKNKAVTHLITQLNRLAQKDKENNFTPFELRRQLIEIYHLFGKILGLTLEDIHKYYFEQVEK